MTDKLKEAAEKYAPSVLVDIDDFKVMDEYNCDQSVLREAFITGATSPEAEEYWRGRHDKETEAFLEWANKKGYWYWNNNVWYTDKGMIGKSTATLLAMFRKEKGPQCAFT